MQTEVALPQARDPRAWDLVISDVSGRVAFEIETRVTDAQALLRRMATKRRDGGIERLVLVVAEPRANRTAIRSVRELIRADDPLDGPAIEQCLRAGRLPRAGGIWFV